jgi:hypothetical protein
MPVYWKSRKHTPISSQAIRRKFPSAGSYNFIKSSDTRLGSITENFAYVKKLAYFTEKLYNMMCKVCTL